MSEVVVHIYESRVFEFEGVSPAEVDRYASRDTLAEKITTRVAERLSLDVLVTFSDGPAGDRMIEINDDLGVMSGRTEDSLRAHVTAVIAGWAGHWISPRSATYLRREVYEAEITALEVAAAQAYADELCARSERDPRLQNAARLASNEAYQLDERRRTQLEEIERGELERSEPDEVLATWNARENAHDQ